MRLIHTLLLLLALPSLGAAAGLVTNSEFKDASGWTLPANSGWRIADDDGRSDASALRYQGLTATAAAPVTRQVNVGQQADYVLTAWAKSDGKLRPTITIEGLGSASAAAVPANTWQPLTIRFNSGDRKQVELRLVADSEATVPVGTSTFDEVQIWLATELPANVRQAAQPGPGGKNIALGASYTLDPAPNYGLCTDPGDRVQLTDGTLSEGYFWTQQGTVGWTRGKPLIVKLDLGQRRPIRGASLNSAAGRAGVTWPAAILLYTSDDNQSWVRAGELINLSGKHGDAPAEGYAVHRYWTGDLATAGRYFAFVIASGGPYFFVDEVEVFEGPETLLTATPAEAPVLDLKSAFLSETISTALTHQVASDLRAVRAMLAEAKLPAAEQRRLAAELTAAEADRKVALTAADPAILPYNAAHRRILAVRGELWRRQGRPALTVQAARRWDPLQPDALPAVAAPTPLELTMLRGEVRSTALDLTNASDQGLALPLRVTGLQLPAEALSVHELVYTATQQGGSTASALPEAKRTANGWEIDLPAGATRQIWLMVDSSKLAAGQQQGQVVLQPAGGAAVTVPFRLRVSTVAMPARPSLSLGGWDYTDTSTYGVTDSNRQQVVEFLKRYHVDTPWATGRAMPFGKHAADGTMTEPPDTKYTDAWLDRWQGARQYAVFNAFPEVLPDTPAAKKRVTEWINFWVGHLKTKGIEPRQLLLLLFDEPHEARSDQVIISYARVIKAAQPEVSIFNDPTYRDPRQATKEMLDLSDILCPNRPMWIENRAAFEAVYPGRRAAGQRLALYSCSGPVRLLDPYSYHRVQGWEAFRLDADGMYYWAFGDNGGHSAWNELAAPGTCYSPAFIGPEGIVTSRQMEAIREGIYDYEYLTLLRAAVAAADKANRQDAAAKAARKLLEEAPGRVLGAAGMNSIEWSTPKDRDLADQVRLEIIEALEKLG